MKGADMKKEIIFIDEETLTEEELMNLGKENTDEDGKTEE